VEEDKGLTIPQAAEKIGKSERQVRRYINSGALPARLIQGKFGPEYRIDDIPESLRKGAEAPQGNPGPGGDQAALQILQSIEKRYEEKIERLENMNISLALELGKTQARADELENKVKLLAAPKTAPPRPLLKRIFGRLGI
jgi:hypothetical protein